MQAYEVLTEGQTVSWAEFVKRLKEAGLTNPNAIQKAFNDPRLLIQHSDNESRVLVTRREGGRK